MSHTKLLSANPNQNSLLATLVQQQTSRLIPRLPRHNAVGYHQPTRPQLPRTEQPDSQNTRNGSVQNPQRLQSRPQVAQRVVYPYAQVQPQYQTVRYQSHSNSSTTTGPYVQTYYGQTQQQTWRPRSSRWNALPVLAVLNSIFAVSSWIEELKSTNCWAHHLKVWTLFFWAGTFLMFSECKICQDMGLCSVKIYELEKPFWLLQWRSKFHDLYRFIY